MTAINQKFYLVSRSQYGRGTHVAFDTLPALGSRALGSREGGVYRLSASEMERHFGPREAGDWPAEVCELIATGATEVVEVNGASGAGCTDWYDARDFDADAEIEAWKEIIRQIDDGTIRAVLTEAEAIEAAREGTRTDSGYGRYMGTAVALRRLLGMGTP